MKLLAAVLLWSIALIVLALLAWGLTLYMAWPLWIAPALFFGAIGLYYLSQFLHRHWIMMRSRSKLARQASASVSQAIKPQVLLTRKWQAAIATLRGSSLKRLGNPLHVLPWYMVIGQSGSGKTTALTRARLASPIQKISQNERIEKTVNYDWWYFDQAVVIDCAGRYVAAQDTEQDRGEWELGLDLLARYRPKAGIDGLVLVIGIDRLIQTDQDTLSEEGRVIRARIEQLIRLFGKRFPIYVLVTKSDQLYGMEAWARQLPENVLAQAMGYLSEEIEPGGEVKFIEDAFNSIDERLQQWLIALLASDVRVTPELLMLPNELDHLRPKLNVFLQTCLADHPYLERPFLRGLFLSSGLQEGGAVSSLLGHALPPTPSHPGTHAGLFLHDFFAYVLPRDRTISRPAQLLDHWRQVTQNIGLAAWLLISLAFGILITVAFMGNMASLALVRSTFPEHPLITGSLEKDVPVLERVNKALLHIEWNKRHGKTQWMIISPGFKRLEERLQQHYVAYFRQSALLFARNHEQADFEPVRLGDADHEAPLLLINLVRRINLTQARLQGADREALLALPQPMPAASYAASFHAQQQLEISHLAWSTPYDGYLSDSLSRDRTILRRLAYTDPNMSWLVGLVADHGMIAAVRAGDFWQGSVLSQTPGISNEARVPAAFTQAGRRVIEDFLGEMQKSTDNEADFLAHRAAFESWYREQRILAWQNFLADFTNAQWRSGEVEWRIALGMVTAGQSPYYRLVDRLSDEFNDDSGPELPSWLLLARELQQLRVQVSQAAQASRAVKTIGALNAVGGQALKETLGGGPRQGSRTIQHYLTAVDMLSQYASEVKQLAADSMTGPGRAYRIAADFHQFENDPVAQSFAKPPAVLVAWQKLTQLKQLLGYNSAADQAVWQLMSGPLNFTLDYIEQQASCELQKNWQANVLWPLQSASDATAMADQLYGAKGSVWAFVDGPARPFLARGAQRVSSVETLGYSMAFSPAFLPMLNRAVAQRASQQRLDAAKQDAQLQAQQTQTQLDHALSDARQKADRIQNQPIPLTITALPTGINPEAQAKPFATLLTIQCAAGAQTIDNYNFPVHGSFAWTPSLCGEVSLQIKIDTLLLVKKYPGPLGMARFMDDFHNGIHHFGVADFPFARAALEALGVRQISVNYRFDGQEAVLNAARLIDAYEQLDRDDVQARQSLQDAQLQQAQQGIQQKPEVPQEPAGRLDFAAVPQQIGQCWDWAGMQGKLRGTQSGELASHTGVRPVPAR